MALQIFTEYGKAGFSEKSSDGSYILNGLKIEKDSTLNNDNVSLTEKGGRVMHVSG